MKKLLLVGALALATVFGANAQDGLEGKWFVGGQLGYKHTKDKVADTSVKTNEYTIMPTIGTFISPDVAVGAAVGYTGSKKDKLKTNNFTIMPLARKYWNVSGGLFFFGQAGLPVTFGDVNNRGGVVLDDKIKNFGVNVQLSPGFDYIINGKFSIETSFNILTVGYNHEKEGKRKSDSFGFFANEGSSFGDLMIGFKMIF